MYLYKSLFLYFYKAIYCRHYPIISAHLKPTANSIRQEERLTIHSYNPQFLPLLLNLLLNIITFYLIVLLTVVLTVILLNNLNSLNNKLADITSYIINH